MGAVLIIVALVLFVLAAFGVSIGGADLQALGLAFLAAAALLGGGSVLTLFGKQSS